MTLLSLESFDVSDPSDRPQSAEFLRGFEAGQKAMSDSLQMRQTEALDAISTTLADMTFGFEEARQHVLSGLAPLMAQVVEVIIPRMLKDTFALHLEEVLQTIVVEVGEEPAEIHVSPDMFEVLSERPLDIPPHFELASNQTIEDGQAVITSAHASLMMDHGVLFESLRAAICSPELAERKTDNG